MKTSKKASESLAITTKIVLPNDTNFHNTLFGGSLLAWMDEVASISAKRHCESAVVTASVNHVSFKRAIQMGDTVTLEAKVSRAFSTSMEIYIDVWVEELNNRKKSFCNNGIFTFVAVDQRGNPIKIPEIEPETEVEKTRFNAALRRKQLALILAGKMNPSDASELKALFDMD